MNIKTRITKIHYDKNAKGVFVDMLEFFSVFYGLVSRLRNTLYDKGILKTLKVDAKVISVGNVTTGGVGKTPGTCVSIKKQETQDQTGRHSERCWIFGRCQVEGYVWHMLPRVPRPQPGGLVPPTCSV